MRPDKYILNDKLEPVVENDLVAWAKWYEVNDRRVALDHIGDVVISTVFLGMDFNWLGGLPLLWETMVFGGKFDQELDRCSGSREQAEAMHARMLEKIKSQSP
jgi:hypothetical protein